METHVRCGAAAVRSVMTLVMVCNLMHSTYVGLCSTIVNLISLYLFVFVFLS